MEADVIDGLFEHGLMGIEIAEEHGGCGATFTAACLVVEELAKVDPAVSVMVDIHNTIINNCVSRWASPELQREWLPRLASDTLGSFCLSEAGSGSDAFALRCAARRDGDDYLLSGEKLWISNSAEAGVFLVMANAAPEKGHRGITCFVVPREAAGLRVGPKEDKLGTRASSRRRLLPWPAGPHPGPDPRRHPRLLHLPRPAGRRSRARLGRAGRGWRRLPLRHRDPQRGSGRHRRADGRPGAGGARPHASLPARAAPVRRARALGEWSGGGGLPGRVSVPSCRYSPHRVPGGGARGSRPGTGGTGGCCRCVVGW